MSEEETSAENEEDLWAAAADDLAQQREMLRDASQPAAPAAEGQPAGEEEQATAVAPPLEAPEAASDAPPLSGAQQNEIGRILDLPMNLAVELGRTKMLINDLLQLGQGSVIELTKLVGEPLEVLVNSRLVAKGEVVVVNEKFGIRITEISSPHDRIKSMK
ncbi:Flagellar motor switch protein FliN [hydrothermal vent metagenome]|uniref:Flagellar motor switch protein FliN n=1 Tax=hydrothermal vent metagenome TaxID=652676 RepID=A0A3B1CI20_9ZZZZ